MTFSGFNDDIPTGLPNYTQWPHLVCAQLPGQTSSPVPFRYFREERTTHGLLCTESWGTTLLMGRAIAWYSCR